MIAQSSMERINVGLGRQPHVAFANKGAHAWSMENPLGGFTFKKVVDALKIQRRRRSCLIAVPVHVGEPERGALAILSIQSVEPDVAFWTRLWFCCDVFISSSISANESLFGTHPYCFRIEMKNKSKRMVAWLWCVIDSRHVVEIVNE